MSSRRGDVTRHSAKREEKSRRLQRCRLLLARDLHASDTWHHGRHFPGRCGGRGVVVLWRVVFLYVFPSLLRLKTRTVWAFVDLASVLRSETLRSV